MAKLAFMLFVSAAPLNAPGTAHATRRRIAERRDGLQTARVHTVDGEIGAHSRIDGCTQGSLIFNPVSRDAAGKIEQGFLLRDLLKRLRNCTQRKQFAIGIQVVVLALVGRVAGRILHLIGVCRGALCEPLSLGAVVDAHFVRQHCSVSCEVLIDLERLDPSETSATRSAGCILFVRKSRAAFTLRSKIFRLHRRQIEEHHNQPMVAQIFRLRDNSGFVPGPLIPAANPLTVASFNGVGHIDSLEIKATKSAAPFHSLRP